MSAETAAPADPPKRKEIFTYVCPWTPYSMAWRRNPRGRFQIAVGSFIEEYINQFQVLQLDRTANNNLGSFNTLCQFDHPYPATKVQFAPAKHITPGAADLIATTGDYLRLWSLSEDNQVTMHKLLNNNKNSDYCAPLTSFDWNETDTSLLGVCSIDTTCTMWDLAAMTPKTQLIAHDKDVFDIAFAPGKDIFGTVGADGSLRMFDLRVPTYPVCELLGHEGAALIWDISMDAIGGSGTGKGGVALNMCLEDPVLAYSGKGEINTVHWCASHEDWINITYNNVLQVLKV
eukprot:gene23550-28560_t